MEKKHQALVAAFASVIAASFSAVFIRIALSYSVDPIALAFWRLFLTAIVMIPYTASKPYYRKEYKALNRKELSFFLLAGLFLAFHFSSWFMSLKYTSTVSSTLLVCTEPIFVIFGGYLIFKESPSRRSIPGLLIAALGIFFIAMPAKGVPWFQGSQDTLFGNFLALFGAASVAGYVLIGRAMVRQISTFLYCTVVYSACCLILFFMTLLLKVSIFDIHPIGFVMAGALALVCQIIGHTVSNWALKHTKAANVSSLYLLEPVWTGLWVFFLWQEIPSQNVMIGGLVLLLGIYSFLRNDR